MASFKHVIYWLIANSIGGKNRIKILSELFKKPHNANELSEDLNIEYKTVRYHLKVLIENNLVVAAGSRYGRTYFISDRLMEYEEYFTKICNELNPKK